MKWKTVLVDARGEPANVALRTVRNRLEPWWRRLLFFGSGIDVACVHPLQLASLRTTPGMLRSKLEPGRTSAAFPETWELHTLLDGIELHTDASMPLDRAHVFGRRGVWAKICNLQRPQTPRSYSAPGNGND